MDVDVDGNGDPVEVHVAVNDWVDDDVDVEDDEGASQIDDVEEENFASTRRSR